ncbi:synapse-associated protein [Anaeramoeba flamelloides]|uniref:Synapse-associated protein n=1 Tax=Anaeramoeba flamelloides TaxID=1746091 RepID=A0ABQ8YNB3_9EUKA|nr:synapse-associated protein [Anaeramoeba flamelloides]
MSQQQTNTNENENKTKIKEETNKTDKPNTTNENKKQTKEETNNTDKPNTANDNEKPLQGENQIINTTEKKLQKEKKEEKQNLKEFTKRQENEKEKDKITITKKETTNTDKQNNPIKESFFDFNFNSSWVGDVTEKISSVSDKYGVSEKFSKLTNSVKETFFTDEDEILKKKRKLPAWQAYALDKIHEEELQLQIKYLSKKTSNFTKPPTKQKEFNFKLSDYANMANATIKEDKRLLKIYKYLVFEKKRIKQEDFWKNYFWRIEVIVENTLLIRKKMENSQDANKMKKENEINGKGNKKPQDQNKNETNNTSTNINKTIEDLQNELNQLGIDVDNKKEEKSKTEQNSGTNEDNKHNENWKSNLLDELDLEQDLKQKISKKQDKQKMIEPIDDKWLEDFKKDLEEH